MNPSSPAEHSPFKLARIFWIGLILLLAGSGPHLVFSLMSRQGSLDPADHPRLAFWLFVPAMFTFFPSLICLLWGAAVSVFRRVQGSRPVVDGTPKFKFEGMFWYGLILFLGCCGPLLLILLCAKLGLTGDSSPNPPFFGLMAGIAFWPSMICMIGGTISAIVKHRKAKRLLAAGTLR